MSTGLRVSQVPLAVALAALCARRAAAALWLLALPMLAPGTSLADTAFSLTPGDYSRTAIVLPADAGPVARFAAQELQA
ncbi:MAG: hypothetical protein AB1505_23960 [Candidatus Latescibacterota bacterium]